MVVPKGYYQDTKMQIAKDASMRVGQEKREGERDYRFNRLRPMTKTKQTWQEKWLAKEESGSSSDSSSEEASKVTSARGEDNPRSGDRNPELGNCNPESRNCHPESGHRNPDSGNSNLGKENDWQGEEPVLLDINMVFTTLAEFHAPMEDVTELVLGATCALFEKLENSGVHMKPLFIWGDLDGTSIGHMLIDGGASINILLLSLFKKLDHVDGDLKHTNLCLSGFQVIRQRQKE
jgi:hypothetical protein